MKLLRETVRKIIMENASIIDLPVISAMHEKDLIIVTDSYSFDVFLLSRKSYDEEYKEIIDGYIGDVGLKPVGKDNTMEVSLSGIKQEYRKLGFGKLLYNVALAVCTKEGMWLMSDRSEVSPDAERIYDTWKDMPSEYEIEQTDHKQPDESHGATQFNDYDPDVDFFLTKDRDDDFHQGSFQQSLHDWGQYDDSDPRAQLGDMIKDWWYFFDEEYKGDFLASGLTKRFKMRDPDSFLKVLENEKLLYRM